MCVRGGILLHCTLHCHRGAPVVTLLCSLLTSCFVFRVSCFVFRVSCCQRSSAAKSGAGYKEPVKAPKPKPRPPASQSSAPAKPRVRAPVDDTPQELSITLRQSTQSKSTARTQEILSAKAVAKPKGTTRFYF